MTTFAIAAVEGGSSWSVSGLLTEVTTIFNSAADLIMANPVAAAFVGLTLAGAGIALFRKVIHVR